MTYALMTCKHCGTGFKFGTSCQCQNKNDVATQKHYTKDKIQVIEFCEVNKVSWCAANVIKYVMRYEAKNGVEDLRKAETYLKTLIQYTETQVFKTPDQL